MKQDIEKQFFKAYLSGGVVNNCIDVMRWRYNPPDTETFDENKKYEKWDNGKFVESTKEEHEKWLKCLSEYYNEILPSKIQADTEAFDDTVIMNINSTLIDEISDNLNECKTIQDKERYLYSLIVPFNELSGLLHTELSTRQPVDKGLIMISNRLNQIITEPTDTVEKSLSAFCRVMFMFANRLDALLLQNRIDLLKLQNECGTYLKTHRTITDVDYYIGSLELAEKYISELPNDQTDNDTAKPQQITIPDNILNELQEKGFIENARTKTLKWLKNKQLLRELLTHDKIKGTFSVAEIERQTPNLFIDTKNTHIKLAKNKTVPSNDSDTLQNILATL